MKGFGSVQARDWVRMKVGQLRNQVGCCPLDREGLIRLGREEQGTTSAHLDQLSHHPISVAPLPFRFLCAFSQLHLAKDPESKLRERPTQRTRDEGEPGRAGWTARS